jgi:hypothetical protein
MMHYFFNHAMSPYFFHHSSHLQLKLKIQTNVWGQYENIKFELSLGWLKMWI